jgi:hypothetical protein
LAQFGLLQGKKGVHRAILASDPLTKFARLLRQAFLVFAALPALYMFFAIQRGAITVPFWDHCALIDTLAPWYDGAFHVSSLWAPQNQARPLIYRLVIGANAVLTDWDVRSEFTYIYACFYGVFALHAWALKKITVNAPQGSFVFPLVLLLASLIVFSPVSHNDHWWSLMFILDAADLLIALSLLTVFMRPDSVTAHVSAAAICWAATYAFANGMFAMLAVALVFQLSSSRILRPNRWAVFWAVNLAALLVCYLPGIVASSAHHPSPPQMAEFFFTFLGLPCSGLLRFPYQDMFDLPIPIAFNALCGVVLVAFSALLCWHARARLRACQPAALILFGFTIFAVISAIITAWGRANFDQFTVSNGNSSRYTIFSAYLMLGQLYYLAAGFSEGWWNSRFLATAAAFAAITFAGFSAVSYKKAITIYNNAHQFNQMVANAYSWGNQPTPDDKFIYPDPHFVIKLKGDLQRLELGPYSNRQFESAALPVGGFQRVFLLSNAGKISQTFIAGKSGLKDILVTLAKPNGRRTAGAIQWQLTEIDNSEAVATGAFDARHVYDWEVMRLKLPYLAQSEGRAYRISLSSGSDDAHALAMPLYAEAAGQKLTVTITNSGAVPETEKLSMALVLDYAE